MAQTAINGIPWPEAGDQAKIEEAVKPAVEVIDTRIVPRYANTSARDLAIPTPIQGQMAYVTTHGVQFYSNAAKWVPLPGTHICTTRATTGQSIPNTTYTNVAMDVEDYDPFGVHSTVSNSHRILPVFPGRYMVTANVAYTGFSSAGSQAIVGLRKNDVDIPGSFTLQYGTGSSGAYSGYTSAIIVVNGTTDYFNVVTYQNTGVSKALVTGAFCPKMEVVYAGPTY